MGMQPSVARGTALIVGGSAETPGGALLAAVAALRMGAGKVQIATVGSVAAVLAVAVPEARVLALPETDEGAIARSAARTLTAALAHADAVLIGTSALDSEETGALLTAMVPLVNESSTVVIDAGAIPVLRDEPHLLRPIAERTTVIPNPSEMSVLLSTPEDEVCDQPCAAVDEAVARLGSVVALRDAVTRTSNCGREHYVDRTGDRALGTAGSGDVLAGSARRAHRAARSHFGPPCGPCTSMASQASNSAGTGRASAPWHGSCSTCCRPRCSRSPRDERADSAALEPCAARRAPPRRASLACRRSWHP